MADLSGQEERERRVAWVLAMDDLGADWDLASDRIREATIAARTPVARAALAATDDDLAERIAQAIEDAAKHLVLPEKHQWPYQRATANAAATARLFRAAS